ncbi:hypothetical protein Q4595_20710, partial [Wenyingzhuangia sp. 1_MG-2023]|nr:hypothetical protein [Wenyingzhuangia sp. 1_MG-2023]
MSSTLVQDQPEDRAEAILIDPSTPTANDQNNSSTGLATRVPFGFAKRFGVLVEGAADGLKVVHRVPV